MEKKTFYTPSGSPIMKTYKKVTEKGDTHLIETGETNIYEKIQECRDECDIRIIMDKLTRGDQVEALRIAQAKESAQYGDATLLNKSLNEVNMIQRNAEKALENLKTTSPEEYAKIIDIINNKVEEQKATEKEEETVKEITNE